MAESGPPTNEDFLAAAHLAVPQWGLDPVAISLLSLSENAVCDVELGDGRHLVLRLHRPGYNRVEELQSEVEMVRSMAASGLDVPLPVPSLSGQYYRPVSVGNEVRQVGVIEWVDGQPLGSPLGATDPDVVNNYEKVGELAARIRVHSSGWSPPAGFVRRRWDADGLVGENPIWGRFWEVETLTVGQRSLFSEARDRLFEVLSALSTDANRFGIIHADLHLGNLMAEGDRLTVIDFDDAGFGWFAHELAVALHPMAEDPAFDDARKALVSGYRRIHPLENDEVELIDVFFVIRSLMLIGWLDVRTELAVYRHFERLAARAETVAERYLSR